MLGPLREDAEIYTKQGNVVIADAENLLAKGDVDGAAALLENMPAEWGARDVKAVAADMLAGIYLQRGKLDEARKKYAEAVPGGELLDDVDESKRLLKTIQDYLAAENALPDARAGQGRPSAAAAGQRAALRVRAAARGARPVRRRRRGQRRGQHRGAAGPVRRDGRLRAAGPAGLRRRCTPSSCTTRYPESPQAYQRGERRRRPTC